MLDKKYWYITSDYLLEEASRLLEMASTTFTNDFQANQFESGVERWRKELKIYKGDDPEDEI